MRTEPDVGIPKTDVQVDGLEAPTMVTFKRLMLWFSLVIGVLAFLVMAGSLDPKQQMLFGAGLLLLIIFLMGTGRGRKVERIRKRSEMVEQAKSDAEEELPAGPGLRQRAGPGPGEVGWEGRDRGEGRRAHH